jgi:hypothetical protein
MIPNQGKNTDAVNFRDVKESESVDIGSSKVKGTPLNTNGETPGKEDIDPFQSFNSGMFSLFLPHIQCAWLIQSSDATPRRRS